MCALLFFVVTAIRCSSWFKLLGLVKYPCINNEVFKITFTQYLCDMCHIEYLTFMTS